MAKGTKKYFYRGNRDKYSVEQRAGVLTPLAGGQASVTIVPDTGVGGMRKVKHLSVSVAAQEVAGGIAHTAYWVLAYVPQGTSTGNINITGANMYEPNQFVMNCGVVDFSAGPVRFTSPVSRNLNSGDSIVLVMLNPAGEAATYRYCVRYAITFN